MVHHARCVSWQRFFAASFAIILVLCASSSASEIVVKKDTIASPSDVVHMYGLEAGTRVGQVLTAPVDGTIVGVQIWWGSPAGGAPPSQEAAIRISSESFNPQFDLTTLAQINSPVLIDGALNEYRFLDPGSNTLPLSVPITAGTRFWIDLELLNPLDASEKPFILMDHFDGAPYPEDILRLPGSANWYPFTIALAGAGELGIRAIMVPVPEPSTYVLAVVGMIGIGLIRRRAIR